MFQNRIDDKSNFTDINEFSFNLIILEVIIFSCNKKN